MSGVTTMDKIMLWSGVVIMVITAGLLLFVVEDLSGLPYILFFVGIGLMGASQYRPLKSREK